MSISKNSISTIALLTPSIVLAVVLIIYIIWFIRSFKALSFIKKLSQPIKEEYLYGVFDGSKYIIPSQTKKQVFKFEMAKGDLKLYIKMTFLLYFFIITVFYLVLDYKTIFPSFKDIVSSSFTLYDIVWLFIISTLILIFYKQKQTRYYILRGLVTLLIIYLLIATTLWVSKGYSSFWWYEVLQIMSITIGFFPYVLIYLIFLVYGYNNKSSYINNSFYSDSFNDNSFHDDTFHSDTFVDHTITTNPATGLPMVGCIDIGGNVYGSSSINNDLI